MNQGSILHASWISPFGMPARSAWPTTSRRSGVGRPSAARRLLASSRLSPAPPSSLDLVEPVEPGLQRAQRLLQAFGEGPADRHRLADRLHRRGQDRLGAGEFLEGEAGDLRHDVVDRRLERGRRRAAGDVVGDLVERIADGQLRRDLGDREAGRLRGQRRGARHARVHLDDDHPPRRRIDRELDIAAAGLDANLAQHRQRGVAHHLEFLVGERQRRRHGDGIARVHAHRVDVLDRADDDAIVRACRGPPPSRIPSSRARSPRPAPRWSARRRCRPR